jgi:ferredoxin-NADP reductase
VSPYLTEELRSGDELELRGPIGGYFNWRHEDGGPLLLIAGGSGLVPLMAMLRHRAATASTVDARLLLSARSLEDVLYREELGELAAGDGLAAHYTLTREPPPAWEGFARRIDAEMLTAVGPAPARRPRIYACGPTAFVERAATLLVALGHAPASIRTERFGATGRAPCIAAGPDGAWRSIRPLRSRRRARPTTPSAPGKVTVGPAHRAARGAPVGASRPGRRGRTGGRPSAPPCQPDQTMIVTLQVQDSPIVPKVRPHPPNGR